MQCKAAEILRNHRRLRYWTQLVSVWYSKQIMTGLKGNRQIYLPPRDSGLPPQEFLLTEAQPRSIGTLC